MAWVRATVLVLCVVWLPTLFAQVNVTTFQYDNTRTGQNTQETVLTPSNVNVSQFGKLFTVPVDGYVYAEPLYLSNVAIAGGTHNVVYVATEHDSMYAIDADNGAILWQQSFINPAAGVTTVSSTTVRCTDLVPEIGITSTPVIDPNSGTIYFLTKTTESGGQVQRLHALDTSTGAEKFGGPVVIAATVNGTGDGGSTVSFNPLTQLNRPGLLLDHGHVILGWASHCDNSPYHGWVMSYAAGSLVQDAVFNAAPNGTDAGIWQSGDGIASDANGNLYFATGNGTYDGDASGDYGDSIVKLSPPSAGKFNVADWFTPYNQGTLNAGDVDLGSGGVLLLPDLPGGATHPHLLVQQGKGGTIYLLDRDNMGQYCSGCSRNSQIVQEIVGASAGLWGAPGYWNGNLYWGAGRDGTGTESLKAYSFNANSSGLLSTTPTSRSLKAFTFSTATPVISSNGNSNGILWILDNTSFRSSCCQMLYAYNATDLGKLLYHSSLAPGGRDYPGGSVKFSVPTVANGKVYVGSQANVSAFGIIDQTPAAATPAFSLISGAYTGPVVVNISDATPGTTIHCTTDGSTPTTSSPVCGAVPVNATTTLQALATASGFRNSTVASASYQIGTGTGVNYGGGFTGSGLILNGSAAVNGTSLRLTGEVRNQAGSAFFSTPLNVQNFTTDFTMQLIYARADGITFCIQNAGGTSLGASGGALGYGAGSVPGIGNSIALKFDLSNNTTEGQNSSGLFTNGASPTVPSTDLTPSGINLHSGEIFSVHVTYDGTTLTMTIIDTSTPGVSFTDSWTIDIPTTVGSPTAFVGFTGGTGVQTAIQDVLAWTYYTASVGSTHSPTTTTLTSSGNPSTSGQLVTFTATVASASGTPTGTVVFQDGSTALSSAALDSSGMATLTTSSLSTGTHTLTATYSGDSQFAGSTSTTLTQTVSAPAPAFTMTTASDTKTISAGQSATFKLSLTPQNSSTATVNLSCSGAPLLATCAVQPTSITLSGSGSSNIMVTVTSASPSAASHLLGAGAWFMVMLALAVVLQKRPRQVLGAVIVGGLVFYSLSCGGGSSSGGTTGGTPKGSYTITVTGDAGGGISQTVNLTLIVQ